MTEMTDKISCLVWDRLPLILTHLSMHGHYNVHACSYAVLLRSGPYGLSRYMRRLLTGYVLGDAVSE